MRTIKFRAKVKTINIGCDKNVGDWVCGDLHLLSKIPHIHTNSRKYIIDTETIGQFTGLYDCNEKEIYEGDIVEWTFFYNDIVGNGGAIYRDTIVKGVIEWEQGGFILKVTENDFENAGQYGISSLVTDTENDVIVIGNIYDNPELLKGE